MGGSSKKVTVGYKYYLGLHMVLCHGPIDAVKKIVVQDREAWSGTQASGSLTINKPDLFGGEKREGGISGTVDVMLGESTQGANSYLAGVLGGLIPGYRGVTSLVLRRIYIGTNPYLKRWAVKVKRTATRTDGQAQWYSAKADIGGDMNPAHIVRECLTNPQWGMGYPEASIDSASFTAAADTLYSEGFGLSLMWAQQESIEQFIRKVMDHIDGHVNIDPASGDFKIKLIRDDYSPGALTVFDESNITSLEAYERRGWGETINEMSVTYRDQATNLDKTITLHDLGNIQVQGAVITDSRQYPGISNGALALRVCQRDLRGNSTPLGRIKIKVNREAWSLTVGDPFKFSWGKYGIIESVYRVTNISTGRLENGEISIDAIEDIFSLPSAAYGSPQDSYWVDPVNQPAAVPNQKIIEAPYWDIVTTLSAADQNYLDPDYGFIRTLAQPPSGDAINYDVMTRVGAAAYEKTGEGPFAPTAQLDGAISYATGGITNAVINIKNIDGLEEVDLDTYAYIDDEAVAIKAIDINGQTITVDRGVLDTVPAPHADNAIVWFAESWQGEDETERVDAEVVDVKLLPSTGQGTLAIGSASAVQVTLDNRAQRPYPPGNLKFNGVAYPDPLVGPVTLAWSHRDRIQQTAYLNTQAEGDIGPEAGTTYNLRIYGDAGEIVNETGLTGTSYELLELARPLQDYIMATWGAGGAFMLYNGTDYGSSLMVDEDPRNSSSADRTFYGSTAHSLTVLSKEATGSYRFPDAGSYAGQSDLSWVSLDAVSVLAIVQFDADLTGARCIVQDGGNSKGFYFGLYNGLFGVWIQDPTNGNKSGTVTAATYINPDEPVMLGCCVDGTPGNGGFIKLYVNGVKVLDQTAMGTFNDFDGTNGTSYGGCYQVLAITNDAAPIGGLLGNIGLLMFAQFAGSTIQAAMEADFWTNANLNTYDYETELSVDAPYVRLKMDEASGILYNSIGAYGEGNPYNTVTYSQPGLIPGAGTAIKLGATGYLQKHDWADLCANATNGFTLSIKLIYPAAGSGVFVWFAINQSDAGRTDRLLLGFNDNTNKAYCNVENQAQTEGTTTYSPGDVLHCFFIYDKTSSDWAYYVNDVLECSGNRALTVSTSDYAFIGMEQDAGPTNGNHLASTIDEFLLFDYAITPARVSVLTQAAVTLGGLNSALRVELEAVRDGLTSRYMHDVTVTR